MKQKKKITSKFPYYKMCTCKGCGSKTKHVLIDDKKGIYQCLICDTKSK